MTEDEVARMGTLMQNVSAIIASLREVMEKLGIAVSEFAASIVKAFGLLPRPRAYGHVRYFDRKGRAHFVARRR